MKIRKIVQRLVAPIIAIVLEFVIKQIDDDDCIAYGYKGGQWITDNCRDLMGKSWEKVEKILQQKVEKTVQGLIMGVDYDDKN